MTDRPIIFSAPMIRALLDGRKTQTRRVLKRQPQPFTLADGTECDVSCLHVLGEAVPRVTLGNVICLQKLPYAVGDRLWVREAACWVSAWGWRYRADNDDLTEKREAGEVGKWRPSIHMPRTASRLTLTVTDVRVQRLQDISEADAVAEGVAPLFTPEQAAARPELNFNPMPYENYLWHGHADLTSKQIDAWSHQYSSYSDARRSYSSLWERLHGPGAWDANPWVVAISFTVQRGNIDQIGGDA